jgi:hypothetical protein
MDPGDHVLSQKLLEDGSVDTFASENRCFADLDRRFPVLFLGVDGRTAERFE